MRTVKEVLMYRDSMLPEDADDLIAEFQDELDFLQMDETMDPIEMVCQAEEMMADYFGLEPDYLEEFI